MVSSWIKNLCFWAEANFNVLYCTELCTTLVQWGIPFCWAPLCIFILFLLKLISTTVFWQSCFFHNFSYLISVHFVPLQCAEPTLNVGGWAMEVKCGYRENDPGLEWEKECVYLCLFISIYTHTCIQRIYNYIYIFFFIHGK